MLFCEWAPWLVASKVSGEWWLCVAMAGQIGLLPKNIAEIDQQKHVGHVVFFKKSDNGSSFVQG